jgi:hypothetical protein
LLISDNDHHQPVMIKVEEIGEEEIMARCEARIGRLS